MRKDNFNWWAANLLAGIAGEALQRGWLFVFVLAFINALMCVGLEIASVYRNGH